MILLCLMDKFVYIYYLILAVMLVWGAKMMKRGEWNEDALSLDQTKALLGFAEIVIIFHHCSHKTSANWLPAEQIHHGLDFFVSIGYLCVALFFFCSGYGMYISMKKKPEFFKGFFSRRILRIIVPTVFMWLVCFITERARGINVDKPVWINVCTHLWFIYALIYAYLVFFICFKLIKNEKASFIVLWTGLVLYIILAMIFSPGSWWYNTIHLFGVGIVFAKNQGKRIDSFKKKYLLRLSVMLIIFAISYALYKYNSEILGLFKLGYNDTVYLIGQMISAYAIVMIVIMISMKIKIGNRLLQILGAMTLEIYVIHPYFVEAFSYEFIKSGAGPFLYIENLFLYVTAVLLCTLIPAYLMSKLCSLMKTNAG